MLADGLRLIWLPEIASTVGNPISRINEWVGRGQYYFDSAVDSTKAAFVIKPGATLVDTFAAEMSRFTSAAIETSLGIVQPGTPKSTAWLFIQTYYAAFYAAHAILRSAGISASNFKTDECQQADKIANSLGFSLAPLSAAQFRCEYRFRDARLLCTRAPGAGVHEQFWRVFNDFVQNASTQIIQSASLTSTDARDIFIKITNLRAILTLRGHNGGNWLSSIRNEVTYRHQHKTWFPYGRSRSECDRLFVLQKEWRKEPDGIDLKSTGNNEAEQFILACAFLVSLSAAVAKDMERRSPTNDSFLKRGPIKLLNQAE